MNSQDLQNLQEAYTQVYSIDEERPPGVKPYTPNRRQPLPEPKPLSGETGDRSGYGADEKFKKPDDRIKKPGTEVPPVQTYGRISRFIPHGIGAHGNRVRSRNSTVIGLDPGAPRSEVIPPQEKKKPSREIVRKTKKEDFELWVNNLLDEGYDLSGYTWEGLYEEYIQNEAYDIYDVILSHLINEGYADTFEAAEAIMVNMSEEWREDIIEDIRGAITYNPNTPIGKIKKRIKGSTSEKREARTRAYQGNRSDAAERYGASQRNPYDDNRGDIPSLRGH